MLHSHSIQLTFSVALALTSLALSHTSLHSGEPVQAVGFKQAGIVAAWEEYGDRLTFGKGQTPALVDDAATERSYQRLDLAAALNHVFVVAKKRDSLSSRETPRVEVTNIRRVFHNGQHNAFTDLVRFRGKFYLTFRSCPDGHMVHPTASVIVMASDDAKDWKQVHQFHVKHRDTRDPHFLVFQDKLFVYTGTWYSGETTIPVKDYDLNLHLGYAAWSEDGSAWHSPILLEGTFGHYVWRANTFGGKAFLCGRRKINFDVGPRGEGDLVESLMLESDDGLIWRQRAVFQEVQGDETAFQFKSDGSIVAIGRRGSGKAQILRSKPPYVEWDRQELDRYIGGPLIVRWGQRYVVGGRKSIGGKGPKTSMYWLVNNELHEFAELPSGGDTSYPGFIELSPTRAIMSWYSSHEKDDEGNAITAVYMADLAIRKS